MSDSRPTAEQFVIDRLVSVLGNDVLALVLPRGAPVPKQPNRTLYTWVSATSETTSSLTARLPTAERASRSSRVTLSGVAPPEGWNVPETILNRNSEHKSYVNAVVGRISKLYTNGGIGFISVSMRDDGSGITIEADTSNSVPLIDLRTKTTYSRI
jgi:hypothetical protein